MMHFQKVENTELLKGGDGNVGIIPSVQRKLLDYTKGTITEMLTSTSSVKNDLRSKFKQIMMSSVSIDEKMKLISEIIREQQNIDPSLIDMTEINQLITIPRLELNTGVFNKFK